MDLVIKEGLVIPASDLDWHAVRAGGPGGQHVNKTSTKVQLRFDLAGTAALRPAVKARMRAAAASRLDAEGKLLIAVSSSRSQATNLEEARTKLADMVRAALVAPKSRRQTRPTRAAKRRRMDAKRKNAEKKARRGKVDW